MSWSPSTESYEDPIVTRASNFIDMQVHDFLAFLESRPDEERWELVGGMPIMMT